MDEIETFLRESNAIEGVYDEDSLQQALYAWQYLSEIKELKVGDILKLHKILMLHQPLMPDEKGYFRKVPVYIGGREALAWKFVSLKIVDWVKEMNEPYDLPDGMQGELSIRLHVAYEKIHPFVDGNGRTGRMLMNWYRLKIGLPILVIHEGPEQYAYYKWFK